MNDDHGRLDETEMSFGDHLEELRRRLLRSIYATLLCFIVVFYFHEDVLMVVIAPYVGVANELRMSAALNLIKPTDAFFSYMKVSIVVSLLIAAPVWIWQGWSFISVGLYKNEKKWVYRFAPLMIGLFSLGVYFGYSVLIPIGLKYLLSFRDPTVLQNWIGLNDYLTFFMTLTLVLGLTFQLPVVLALLARLDIIDIPMLREKRRHFILGAFIISALLTPPDAVTQVLMAIPLLFLYEFGILLAWLGLGKDRPPVDWSIWRKRGLVVAALLVVFYFAQDALISGYRGRLVEQKIQRLGVKVANDGIPYMKLFSECRFIDSKADRAYMIRRVEKEELWIVGSEAGARPVKLVFKNDRLTATSSNSDYATFLLQASTQSVHASRPETLHGDITAGSLITALEQAFPEEAADLDVLLAGLVGSRPEGLKAFRAEDDDEEAARAAVEGWRRWRTENPDWRFEETE